MQLLHWLVFVCLIMTGSKAFSQHHFHVEHAPANGIFVQAPGQIGLIVDSAIIGSQITESQGTGQIIAKSGNHGMYLLESGKHGIWIDSTQLNGIQINRTGEHGIQIKDASLHGIEILQSTQYGLNVSGGQRGLNISDVTEGIRITQPADNGISIHNPYSQGIEITSAGQNGAFIRNSEGHGVRVFNTGASGIKVEESGSFGVEVEASLGAGISIKDAGAQGVFVNESSSHSFHSSASKGKGTYIVDPDSEGIHILRSGLQGILIDSAGADGININAAADDGLTISDPQDDGINIINPQGDGIHVNGAGSTAGLFISTATSTDPAVYVTHSNDDEVDLEIGGDGKVVAGGHFEIQMDGDNSIGEAFFQIRNSAGTLPLVLGESGDLAVAGHLSKGSGSFKIDHPLDPKNKYLYHSFVESPDMMNIYNGNTILDEEGESVIEMPDWFEPLNRDFRYQLTPIGAPADLYVASEIKEGKFKIAGGQKGQKVSWQVTGIRQDKYANAHRLRVEVEKEEENKGTYLHPDVWDPK